MSKYGYVDPIAEGYKRVYFTKREHNRLFPRRKITFKDRYEYYINKDELLILRLVSYKLMLLLTLAFPFMLVGYGLFLVEDLIKEYKEMYCQKKYGNFGMDSCHSGTNMYNEALNVLRCGRQYGLDWKIRTKLPKQEEN